MRLSSTRHLKAASSTKSGTRDYAISKQKIAVDRRIARLESGNFGDHKFCRDGVWELRIDLGPGYRLYCATASPTLILLLCGGDKRTQSADIGRACDYWKQWQGERDAKRTS